VLGVIFLRRRGEIKKIICYGGSHKSFRNRGTFEQRRFLPVLDWIAAITAHIPDKGEQLVRYYGYYSNVSRGKRKKNKAEERENHRD
jgi:hypothetical protein